MADATNGYVLQQQIYTGKNVEQRMPEVGFKAPELFLTLPKDMRTKDI